MWTVSFGGGNNQGLGSARSAILLLILVLPSMIINVRRFREERQPMTAGDLDDRARASATAGQRVLERPRARASSNVVLVIVALFWLIPTIGLFISSLRTAGESASSGWWTVFTKPAELTLENYANLLDESRHHGLVLEHDRDHRAEHRPRRGDRRARRRTPSPGWSSPGRDWLLIVVIVLLVVPVQVALIPLARLFGAIGIFGSVAGVVLFHVAFGLPFAIFLLRNFFAEVPGELLEAARLDGAGEWRIFFRVILPLGGPAIASLGDLPVPVDVERHAGRADLHELRVAAAHGRPPVAAAPVRQRTSTCWRPGAFLSMIVPLIVFFAFQRYFVQALLAGSQK